MPQCYGCFKEFKANIFGACEFCGYIYDKEKISQTHIQPGEILANRYVIGAVKGYGSFGVTYIAWDNLIQTKVAIKEYLPAEFSTRAPGATKVTVFSGNKNEQYISGMNRFLKEAQNLARFTGTNGIVKIYDSFEANGTAYIITEFIEGITLKAFLNDVGTLDPQDAVDMILPSMEALCEVHKAGIVHRDIAPDNIMISENQGVKIIDFGAARHATTSHSRSLSVILKQGYSPIEQYTSNSEQGAYTDVYAMAATLYKMITGVTPPEAMSRQASLENTGKDLLEPLCKYCPDVPENIENAILNALLVRKEDRTRNFEDFIEELTSDKPVKLRKNYIKKLALYRLPLWVKILVPVSLGISIMLMLLLLTGVIGFKSTLDGMRYTPRGMVRVPSVINNSLDAAEILLSDNHLSYVIKDKVYSNVVEKDRILSQGTIAGATVTRMSEIELVICGGVERIQLPVAVGKDSTEIIEYLENIGLTVLKVEEYSSYIQSGCVIKIDAEMDSRRYIDKNAPITLYISKGIDPSATWEIKEVLVPDFIGMSLVTVDAAASEIGILIKFEYVYSDNEEKDIILSQSVEAGTEITNSQVIVLTVSLGKNLIIVPDVVYREKDLAVEELEAKGLVCTIKYSASSTVAKNHIISQSISADSEVEPGTGIELVVSSGAGTSSEAITQETTKSTIQPTSQQPTTKAHVHDYSYSSIQISAPTCTTAGVNQLKCSCGDVITQNIAALGHVEVTIGATPATCTTAGSTQSIICDRCKNVISAGTTIPATGQHNYVVSETVSAGCESAGYQKSICSYCGNEKIDTTAALGHDLVTVAGYAATCSKSGMTDGKKCKRCSYSIASQEIPKKAHTERDDGSRVYCTVCNYEIGRYVTQYRYYHYTDDKDIFVCPYTAIVEYGCSKDKVHIEYTPWLDSPLTAINKIYRHYKTNECTNEYGCQVEKWDNEHPYRDSSGVVWYHQETQPVLKYN